MKTENLEQMTAKELDDYAKTLGITKLPNGVKSKVELIQKRREREATIKVAGLELVIPIKRFHDKKVSEVLSSPAASDGDLERILNYLIGDEQMQEVIDACTDEDGTFDLEGLAYIFTTVITSPKLKNF